MPPSRSQASVRIERTLPAARETVFDAFVTPDVLMRWWGPRGVQAVSARLDVRPGGRYAIEMEPEGGEPFTIAGEYRVVDPPHRLVQTWAYRGPAVRDPVESVVTVEFTPDGDGTRVVLTQEFLAEPSDLAGRDRGWNSAFDRLAELMAERSDPT